MRLNFVLQVDNELCKLMVVPVNGQLQRIFLGSSRFLQELESEFDVHFTRSRDRIGNFKQAFDAIKIILKSKHLVRSG